MRVATAAFACTLCGAAVASADPEAKRMFEEGRRLLDRGRVAEACRRFADSLARERAAGTMLNLGECAERDGRLARAWSLYDEAAREYDRTSKPAAMKFARDRAAALEPRLAAVIVRVAEPGTRGLVVRVGGEDVPPAAEISRFQDPGRLTISARAPGRAPFEVAVDGIAGAKVAVDVPALALRPRAPAEPPPRPAPRASPWRYVFWTSIATGIAGGGLWFHGYRQIEDAERGLCPPDPQFMCGPVSSDERERLIDQGSTGRIFSRVGIGVVAVSLAAAGISAYLAYGRGGRSPAIAVAPAVSPSGIGVALSAGF